MKLRIAKKVIEAVSEGRHRDATLGRANRRWRKTREAQEVDDFFRTLFAARLRQMVGRSRRLVASNHRFDIPPEVAVCPYCEAKLTAQAEAWYERDDGTWGVEEIDLDCTAEPDIDSPEYREFVSEHTYMPYVFWLPVRERVQKWINKRFDFHIE